MVYSFANFRVSWPLSSCMPIQLYFFIFFQEPFELSVPKKVQTWQVWYSIIKGTMFCWSFSLTAILGTVRCIAIHFPFCRINKVLVLSIAVGMALFTLGISLGMYFEEDEHILSPHTLHIYGRSFMTNPKITVPNILAYAKSTVNMVISLSSAGLSVWGLNQADKVQKSTSNDQRKRSGREAAITIAYLNILIGLQFILLIMSIVLVYGYPRKQVLVNYTLFLTYPFVNTLLSAINPLIYILRCSKIRRSLFSRTAFSTGTVVSGNTSV